MIGIYKITNNITGKSYIGQSINIQRRWREHKTTINNKNQLYADFKKYGLDSFTFEVLEECDVNDLNEREIYWISYYDTFNNGYNLTVGGDQRILIIVKKNDYGPGKMLKIEKENIRKVLSDLTPSGYKLFFYLCEKVGNLNVIQNCSIRDFCLMYKVAESTARKAKAELINKKYIVEKNNKLYFYMNTYNIEDLDFNDIL